MIDTGASGVFISEDFFYDLQQSARGWRSMEVDLATHGGKSITLSSKRPDPLFICLPASFPWLPAQANLIVLGVSFLQNRSITIDTKLSKLMVA